jgi:hypothetical protein
MVGGPMRTYTFLGDHAKNRAVREDANGVLQGPALTDPRSTHLRGNDGRGATEPRRVPRLTVATRNGMPTKGPSRFLFWAGLLRA